MEASLELFPFFRREVFPLRPVGMPAPVAAATQAPVDTRAWFRGELLRRFPDEVVAASWDSLIVEVPGQRELQRIPLVDPHKGTAAQLGPLVAGSTTITDLLNALRAPVSDAASVSVP